MYKLKTVEGENPALKTRLLGSGAILREVEAGAELLARDFGVTAEVWSVTSFTELRREGLEVERWNRLHPEAEPKIPYVEQCLGKGVGPVVAATDYIKTLPDGVRPFVPARYKVLGTDGFGRSDYRRRLRAFFEVDRHHVAVAALKALAEDQLLPARTVSEAIQRYGIDPDRPIPTRT
jgi:pyruvate dehydrogenase E1 component